MTDSDPSTHSAQPDPAPPRRRRRARVSWLSVLVSVVFLAGVAFLAMLGRGLDLPDWATERIEAEITRSLGEGDVQVAGSSVEIDRRGVADIVLEGLTLRDASGVNLGQINRIAARVRPIAMIRDGGAPTELDIAGAQITVRRAADGSFQLSFGGSGATVASDLSAALDIIETTFSSEPLSGITEIAARDLTITLEDARSGRVWQATNGSMTLRNSGDRLNIDVFTEVFNGTVDLARVQLSFAVEKGGGEVQVAASLQDAAARDIALQSPALSYLGVLDAPVSGAIRAIYLKDEGLTGLAATLDIGAGRLAPGDGVQPVGFNEGRVYLEYDPEHARLDVSEYFVESNTLRLSGSGRAFLGDFRGAWPTTLTTQLTFDRIEGAPEGVFEGPVAFDEGFADVRLTFDPFGVEIGQAALIDGESRMIASGSIAAGTEGWETRIDVTADRLEADRVLSLWPLVAVPNTRRWLSENLLSGNLSDVAGAFRFLPGEVPQIGLTFEFDAAKVRFLPHFPPITKGRGHAALDRTTYSMTLTEGSVLPERGGPVRFDGSTLRVSGLEVKDQFAHITLRSDSTLEAALSLMNNPPFRVLDKADLPAAVANARAVVEADINFELIRDLLAEDVDFDARGTLSALSSDQLVPDRQVTGDRLDVRIQPAGIRITGPVELDGEPIDITVSRSFEGQAPVELEGTFGLSPAILDVLGIRLPDGTLSGAAPATVSLTLPKDEPPLFRVSSGLQGAGLRIDPLGWEKSPEAAGLLEVSGRLGPEPRVDALNVSAPGFLAEGRIDLAPGGDFLAAEMSRVRAGGWFDAPLRLEARGDGQPPRVVITGGRIDVRDAPDGGGGPGAPVPMQVQLDSLQITDAIAVTALRAELIAGNGFTGDFVGRVNGGAAIRGRLVPANGRTAIRLDSDDAGRALEDAGIFRFARGGVVEAVLTPRPDGPGFDGVARIRDTRLTEQPVVVGLLDAVSVIGILDEMQGAGVLFDSVETRFRILPGRVIVERGSAVGASLGISIDGALDTNAGIIDMQGVISPIYLLNSVGSFLTRRGEGLFGVTFTLTGDVDNPRVGANPLSLLTPGMFREIFRRAPPELSGSEQALPDQETQPEKPERRVRRSEASQ